MLDIMALQQHHPMAPARDLQTLDMTALRRNSSYEAISSNSYSYIHWERNTRTRKHANILLTLNFRTTEYARDM